MLPPVFRMLCALAGQEGQRLLRVCTIRLADGFTQGRKDVGANSLARRQEGHRSHAHSACASLGLPLRLPAPAQASVKRFLPALRFSAPSSLWQRSRACVVSLGDAPNQVFIDRYDSLQELVEPLLLGHGLAAHRLLLAQLLFYLLDHHAELYLPLVSFIPLLRELFVSHSQLGFHVVKLPLQLPHMALHDRQVPVRRPSGNLRLGSGLAQRIDLLPQTGLVLLRLAQSHLHHLLLRSDALVRQPGRVDLLRVRQLLQLATPLGRRLGLLQLLLQGIHLVQRLGPLSFQSFDLVLKRPQRAQHCPAAAAIRHRLRPRRISQGGRRAKQAALSSGRERRPLRCGSRRRAGASHVPHGPVDVAQLLEREEARRIGSLAGRRGRRLRTRVAVHIHLRLGEDVHIAVVVDVQTRGRRLAARKTEVHAAVQAATQLGVVFGHRRCLRRILRFLQRARDLRLG
eukprot:scaffold7381_cov310-Pinguiococcus_pyrenoidosus.AAC.136